MAIFNFFKTPKHQQYEYKPRFWDPRKEELEERLQRIEEMKGGDSEAMKARISGGLRRGYHSNAEARKKQILRSNMILIGIIVLLIALSYLFLTLYLPDIVNAIE